MTDICYCDMGEHPEAKQPNGSNGVLHIPCSPNSSTSSLTETTQEEPSSRTPIIPRNFVWRLQGGRRASTSTNSTEPDQEDAMAAEDVVAMDGPISGVLRDSFDPWNRQNHRRHKGGGKGSVHGHDNDDEICKGCIKISRARASTALRDRKRAGSHESSSTLPTAARPNPNPANPTKQNPTTVTVTVTVTMPGTLQHSDLDDGGPEAAPDQLQELKHDGSVLSIAVSGDYIFTGTSKGQIVVWSLSTYQLVQTIQAHKRSVLCLFLSEDGKYLFSTACEPIINVWCPKSFTRLYEIYSTYDVGDVFSVVYSPQNETVYFGTQTQYIQWVGLKDEDRKVSHDSANHPDRRQHKFFDSRAVGGTSTPRRTEDYYSLIPRAETVLEVDPYAVEKYAHYGWVFCMQIAKGPTVLVDDDEEVLVSGGGDGTIKLWRLSDKGPGYHEDEDTKGSIQELMVLGEDDAESVMSLFVDGSFLYAGKLHGIIELWDLDTKQRLRVIHAHTGNINAVGLRFGLLWSASTDGFVSKHSAAHTTEESHGTSQDVSQRYQCLSRWKAHNAKILSAAAATYQNHQLFITGANDNTVRIWHVNSAPAETEEADGEHEDMMIRSLRQFVSYKTVSSRPEFTEDCRKGATFLGSLFKRLGAQVEMLSSDGPHNPVVFAKFSGKLEPAEERKRVLFYGHYDVVPADMAGENWKTDPFKLVGQNGYLYGRGVSDNKGPIIAALYAVSDLLQAKALDSDIIFLIEGEEESGSRGFEETIHKHKDLIGHIDYVLLANSYWLDDEVPCLTYGLRGVLHATVCVDSKHPDLHSGVDGSNMISEPLTDLTLLLGKLKGPKNRVNIPGFYDGILPITEEEELRYDDIASILIKRNPTAGPIDALKRSLMARWREPNLTIHRYNVSGPDGSLISSHATANVSIRLVPGQEVEEVISKLKSFLKAEYEQFDSENTLTVRIDNKAEPWLGVPGNYIFRTLEEAVMRAWGSSPSPSHSSPSPSSSSTSSSSEPDTSDNEKANGVTLPPNATNGETTPTGVAAPKTRKPLYIREGGSIPPIRFLEKEFNAPAAHLPCGQASDSAHLHNERLRLVNLQKSREIFTTVFRKL